MFTDDLVLVYKGNGVFKQVPKQGRNDYKVVMWSEIDTGNGKREERCEISGLYDADGPGLCDKLDENLKSQGPRDGCDTSLTAVRPSLCDNLSEVGLAVGRPSMCDSLGDNLTSYRLEDGFDKGPIAGGPGLCDKLDENLTSQGMGD